MKNLNKIIKYFNTKFNHDMFLELKYDDNNISWPEMYLLNCSKCNVKINAYVSGSSKIIKDFPDMPYKQLGKIKIIMRETTGINDISPHIRDYDKEEDLLDCNEVMIKKLLE